jgi:type VI secretion system protein ImpB
MAADTGPKFIRRNRPPRVHISYEDPYDAERQIELPFVMGVLSDLSGNDPGAAKPEVADRAFLEFDMDNFDQRMAAIEPGVSLKVDNKLGEGTDEKLSVNLRFKKIEDFGPQLSNLLRYMDGKVAAGDQLKALLNDPQLMAALRDRMAERGPEQSKADQ